jgi:hypothetical protein
MFIDLDQRGRLDGRAHAWMQDRREFLIMTSRTLSVDCCYTQQVSESHTVATEKGRTFAFNVQEMRIEGIASRARE